MSSRLLTAIFALCAASLAATLSAGAQELRIGVAAPTSGPYALLGAQIKAGAVQAIEGSLAVRLFVADDGCSAEAATVAARQFVQARVSIVVGFLCAEAASAALPLLGDAHIPVISPGARADVLTDASAKTHHPFFRLAPRQSDEAEAVAAILAKRWREALFAITDDGTIYGRELAETVRFSTEQSGIKPVFVDTYRPQLDNQIGLLGRLRKAGATHVFVGGDRDDIAVIARDAKRLGYDLTVAGGEALRSAGTVPLAEGVLMIGLPEWADLAADATLAKLKTAGIEPEGYFLPTFAAVEVAKSAFVTAKGDPTALLASLREDTFKTVLGPMKFDGKGDLTRKFYQLFRYDGVGFEKVE